MSPVRLSPFPMEAPPSLSGATAVQGDRTNSMLPLHEAVPVHSFSTVAPPESMQDSTRDGQTSRAFLLLYGLMLSTPFESISTCELA